MNGRDELFLGVIAVATLATAIVQIGLLVAAGMLARRINRLAGSVERELKPLAGHLNAIGRDASRAVSLATAQVERVDRLFADVMGRAEATLGTLQAAVVGPVREGSAMVAGLRALLQALRNSRSGQGRPDDEDALFI